jgi:hypothetical protein
MLRRTLMTFLLTATLLGGALLAHPGASQAKIDVSVGVGDQNVQMFDDPLFQAADIRHVRYFVPWNATRHRAELAKVVAYVTRARRDGISVMVHISTDDLRIHRAHLPSAGAYRTYVGRLVRVLRPLGVREWGVWNEANNGSQPTWDHPAAAARYYEVMRTLCRGCRIIALDVLDQRKVEGYVAAFYRALPKRLRRGARYVGVHNYGDVNRHRTSGLRTIMTAVHRYVHAPRYWLTETGGIVELGSSFRCNQTRAARATSYLFTLLKQYRRTVDRAYIYNWYGANCRTRMDTGVVNADGSRRPSYTVLRRALTQFKR